MYKYFLLVLTALLALTLAACLPKGKGSEGESVNFESFKLTEQGMTAELFCYEANKTEKGVRLEQYTASRSWDADKKDFIEEKNVIKQIDGDEELYRQLCKLWNDCRGDKWNGFKGKPLFDVLDGTSMNFTAVLSDGSRVEASGMNAFPKNYDAFCSGLDELLEGHIKN